MKDLEAVSFFYGLCAGLTFALIVMLIAVWVMARNRRGAS